MESLRLAVSVVLPLLIYGCGWNDQKAGNFLTG